jgi:hypothetical protein
MRHPRLGPAHHRVGACALVGISPTRFYGKLVPLDPELIIRNGERSLVDVARLVSCIADMPRGPRKPLKLPRAAKGKRRR